MVFMSHSLLPLAVGMEVVSILFWCAIIIALIFVSFIGYRMLRRWMADDEPAPAIGFTLGDLRQLHKEGKMTDAEYDRARGKMVAAAKKATDAMPEVLHGRKRPPPAGG